MSNANQRQTLNIENARLIFKNFSGRETKFNREGNKNFCVRIDDPDLAQQLAEDGWNVHISNPIDVDEAPWHYIQVSVNFDNIPPNVYMITRRGKTKLDAESVSNLDYADIVSADLIIRPYHWEVNGKSGIKAYLKTAYIVIEEDEFADKYAEPDSLPF